MPPRRHGPTDLADRTTNELLAILEVMFLVATADEHFSPQERARFLSSAESLSEGRLNSGKLSRLVDSWGKRDLDDVGIRLQELARDLTDETGRRIAFGLAQSVANADGAPAPVETKLLGELAVALGLSADERAEIERSVRMSEHPPEH